MSTSFADMVARAREAHGAAYDGPPREGQPRTYGGIDRLLDVLHGASAALAGAGGFDHERGAVALRWLEHEVFPLLVELDDHTLRHDMVDQLDAWTSALGRRHALLLGHHAREAVIAAGESFTFRLAPQVHYRDTLVMFHVGRTHQVADVKGLWVEQILIGNRAALGEPLPMHSVIAPDSDRGGITINTSRVLAGELVNVVVTDRRKAGDPRVVTVILVGERAE